ncbi:MAG: aminotransferase DegT [Chloroflexi bacterium]|nr:aminotransferase DegT [Chloroflexota bacterium]
MTTSERLACDGGAPLRTRPFPSWPVWSTQDEDALLRVLRSGRWGEIDSDVVGQFEARFAAFQQARHCVAVVNGTAALRIAYRAVGVGYGDEVIVPPYTFIATASAALEVGAVPVFADIDPDTYLLDPAAVADAITPRTRAIVPVHVAGCPADMDAFRALAGRHGLRLIEDAAQAPGASWGGQGVGSLGDLGTFSFQASKNLNAGEGGAIVTNDPELAEVVWSLHNVGRTRTGAWYHHELLGGNDRLSAFHAALLITQLDQLPEQMSRREAAAQYLDTTLATIEGIKPVVQQPQVTAHARHLYMFRYSSEAFGGLSRDGFVGALVAEGIPCSAGYSMISDEVAIKTETERLCAALGREQPAQTAPLSVARRACDEGVWLPQRLLLAGQDELHDVVEAVRKIQRLSTTLAHA